MVVGAWGTAIFADDLALDIRGAWRDGVLRGDDPQRLTERLIAEHGLDATAPIDAALLDGEQPAGWFALALAQHETGRLQSPVAARALALIDAGGDAERFGSDRGGRRRVLERLAGKLAGPRPAPKRIRPYRPPDPRVATGDVIRVFAADRSRSGLFVVTGIGERGMTSVRGLAWTDAAPPPDAAALAYLSAVDRGLLSGHVSDADADVATPFVATIHARRGRRAFGPHVGDVIARGLDVERPTDDTGTYADWDYLVDTVGSDLWDLCLRTTRRRLERYGAGWAGADREHRRRVQAHDAWLASAERAQLLATFRAS